MAQTTHDTEQMDITLNGDPRSIPAPATLLSLLETLGLDPRTVVVELNREIVRRPKLAETPVRSGDSIELVHFVGGG
jgi:thiamine biosynthesis protein ThiS